MPEFEPPREARQKLARGRGDRTEPGRRALRGQAKNGAQLLSYTEVARSAARRGAAAQGESRRGP